MFRKTLIISTLATALMGSMLSTQASAGTTQGPLLIFANPNAAYSQTGQTLSGTDSNAGILSSRINTSSPATKWFTYGNYSDPAVGATADVVYDFTLDAKHNKIYWIDKNGVNVGTIGGCNGAASCGQLLYSAAELGTSALAAYITGLGIDAQHGTLFAGVWDNAASAWQIKRMSTTRNLGSISVMTHAGQTNGGGGIGSIVYYNNWIYFTDVTSNVSSSGVYAASTIDDGYQAIIQGGSQPELVREIWGLAIDRDHSKIYWSNWTSSHTAPYGSVGVANLTTPYNADFAVTPSNCGTNSDQFVAGPSGAAYDFHTKRITWGNWNYSSAGDPASARVDIVDKQCAYVESNQSDFTGTNSLVSHGQTGSVAYLYKPEIAKAAKASFTTKKHAVLKCTATFANDRAEARLFMAPSSYTYKWMLNGKKVTGAASSLRAKKAGNYTCAITAKNYAGSTITTSAKLKVTAAQAR